jgi:hypothetical protein
MLDCLTDGGLLQDDGTITDPAEGSTDSILALGLDILMAQRIGTLELSQSPCLQARIVLLDYLMAYFASVQLLAEEARRVQNQELSVLSPLSELTIYLPGSGWLMNRFPFGEFKPEEHFGPLLTRALETAMTNYGRTVPLATRMTFVHAEPGSRKKSVVFGAILVPQADLDAPVAGHGPRPSQDIAAARVGEGDWFAPWESAFSRLREQKTELDIPCPIPQDEEMATIAHLFFPSDPGMQAALGTEFNNCRSMHGAALKATRNHYRNSALTSAGVSPLATYLHYLNAVCLQAPLVMTNREAATPFE